MCMCVSGKGGLAIFDNTLDLAMTLQPKLVVTSFDIMWGAYLMYSCGVCLTADGYLRSGRRGLD